jgi:hypothetical protein
MDVGFQSTLPSVARLARIIIQPVIPSLTSESESRGEPDFGPVDIVVTVKAYPVISQRHGEAVCVAGIRTDTEKPKWARLWPIPFRNLAAYRQFKKYQRIHLKAKPGHDGRPETLTPDVDTITLGPTLSTANDWRARRRLVEPLIIDSTCEVQRLHTSKGTSLAVVRVGEVQGLEVEPESSSWSHEQEAILSQLNLLGPSQAKLEKVPFTFKLRYKCHESGCREHLQTIVDWEIGEAYRSWRGFAPQERVAKIREKWLGELFGPHKESLIYIGNMAGHPNNFLVLGVFWPPKLQGSQLSLLQ